MRVSLLLFLSGFLLFLFLLWLLWPKLPKVCWIVVVTVGTLVLFLFLEKCFQLFTIEDNVCSGFIIYGFSYVEVCSFCPCFLESFFLIINGCWILSRAFSASTEIIIWFLSFSLLIWCMTLIDLQILKNPCIPGRDAHLVMMCDFLNMLLDSVC